MNTIEINDETLRNGEAHALITQLLNHPDGRGAAYYLLDSGELHVGQRGLDIGVQHTPDADDAEAFLAARPTAAQLAEMRRVDDEWAEIERADSARDEA